MTKRLITGVMGIAFFIPLICLSAVAQTEPQPMELNGTEWDITLVKGGDAATAMPDKLIFKDGKFSSEYFVAEGYSPTNYTPSLKDDGTTTIFETMQSKDSGDLGFWRGEISGNSLKGTVSFTLSDGSTFVERYSFRGGLASGELKEKIPYQPPASQAEPKVEETPESAAGTEGTQPPTESKGKSLWQRIIGGE